MSHLAGFGRRHGLEQLLEERSAKSNFVPCHMYDDDAEQQGLEVVLMLESTICGNEYITSQLRDQYMDLQMLPAV